MEPIKFHSNSFSITGGVKGPEPDFRFDASTVSVYLSSLSFWRSAVKLELEADY
jgi:hypothetical protein